MSKEVYIPQLGQTVDEVRLVRWLVPDGAKVEQGQEILEVETDKAIFPVEANARGVLHIGPYGEGDVVPVLTTVAVIGTPEERFEPQRGQTAGRVETPPAGPGGGAQAGPGIPGAAGTAIFASPRARKLAAEKQVDLDRVTPSGWGGQRIAERDVVAYLGRLPRATPVAQRMAAEAGVDLQGLAGTGPGGRVMRGDVAQAAKEATPPATPPVSAAPDAEVVERVPLKGVRGIIADRMAASAHTTARVTLLMEVDATELVAMRERLKARIAEAWGFAPGYNDLLTMIVAIALRKHPAMNARLAADAIEILGHVNVGMAVDTERGLLVPVIRDADRKSLHQVGAELRELVDRARNGRSLPDDLSGGTFTITNLGMYDVYAFTPVINLPETAILGVGCITRRPVVHGDNVEVRQMMVLSLAFDHRVVDGGPAARFLQTVKELIEEPYLWVAG